MPPIQSSRSFAISLAFVAFAFADVGKPASAADHTVPPKSAIFYCSSVRPGDTVTLPSGTRGPLSIRDCNGTAANPITIRNDPRGSGPVVIQRSSGKKGGFILACNSCVGVVIDGSAKWQGAPAGKTYGIKVTMTGGASPSVFFAIRGMSRFITVRNVEIDGAWPRLSNYGSGLRINDLDVNRSAYPGLWREGILIEHNYIHDVAMEGMYIGPNYNNGDLPLRNVEVRFNRTENTGQEGINTKSMWEGNNRVHHNFVRRAGINTSSPSKSSQYSGIKNMSGTVKIYNNWVEATGQHGIQVWTQEGPRESEGRGPFEAHIWNNVVIDAGKYWQSYMNGSYGISLGAQDGREKPVPFVYNNTIVNPRLSGIHLSKNVGAGFVRDNIIAGAGGNPVISAPRFVDLVNNQVGSVAQMQFADPGKLDFSLKVGSPARNAGSAEYPSTDYADVARPKEGAADQGAYEGN